MCKTHVLAAFAAMLVLGGCGLKGPLYMPPPDPDPQAQQGAQAGQNQGKAQQQGEQGQGAASKGARQSPKK